MPNVDIEGFGQTTCDEGRRLVLCIEDAGVDILHRCGGNARCTTCVTTRIWETPVRVRSSGPPIIHSHRTATTDESRRHPWCPCAALRPAL